MLFLTSIILKVASYIWRAIPFIPPIHTHPECCMLRSKKVNLAQIYPALVFLGALCALAQAFFKGNSDETERCCPPCQRDG